MNATTNFTVKSLRANRVRTLVTIAGVALAAALLTAVLTTFVSLNDFLYRNEAALAGTWMACVEADDSSVLDERITGAQADPQVSGTAIMRADAVASALPYKAEYVYDRHERREKRPAHEIGISAVRGGTIVGEHSVLFCGRDEIIEIKHTALSREVFAVGAVDAAAFMAERTQPGMYDMNDVIASK